MWRPISQAFRGDEARRALLFDVGSPGRYALAGIGNTMVGFSAIAGLTLAGMGPVGANAMGYAAGLGFSYVAGRSFTFAGRARRGSAARHVAAFGLAYALNLGGVLGAISAGTPELGAQALGTVLYAVVFYLLSRAWVFPAAAKLGSDRLSQTA